MCSLVALKGVCQIMSVVHVTLSAQVIVKTDEALPAHAPQPVFLAAVADDVGVPHTWGWQDQEQGLLSMPLCYPTPGAYAPIWALS